MQTINTSYFTINFSDETTEAEIEKAIELAGNIDYYYEYIDDGKQWRAAGVHNKLVCNKLQELGCKSISIPKDKHIWDIDVSTFCSNF